jgi:enoyl-CoA hydratase
VLSNRLIDAAECVRLGVFDEAVDAAQVQPRALALAREMAAFPERIYAQTKRVLREAEIERMRAAAEMDPLLAAWVS